MNERKGFGTWKDENNKNYFLHRDDTLIKELGLVWIMTGYKQTEEQIKYGVSRRNKGRGTKLKVYFIDVGQADCILLVNNKSSMLIDAGNNEDGFPRWDGVPSSPSSAGAGW